MKEEYDEHLIIPKKLMEGAVQVMREVGVNPMALQILDEAGRWKGMVSDCKELLDVGSISDPGPFRLVCSAFLVCLAELGPEPGDSRNHAIEMLKKFKAATLCYSTEPPSEKLRKVLDYPEIFPTAVLYSAYTAVILDVFAWASDDVSEAADRVFEKCVAWRNASPELGQQVAKIEKMRAERGGDQVPPIRLMGEIMKAADMVLGGQ